MVNFLPHLLEVRNLVKSLGGREILQNVSFDVDKGEIAIINGPSGSGKSTLLRCLNRLIEPDSGEIYFEGKNIFDMDVLSLRRLLGFVPQVPVMFDGTVRDNLLFAPKIHNLDVSDEDLEKIIKYVGLPVDYLDKPAHELSVGEQQRVSIARAMILKPRLLLMDEPTSHLDPENTMLVEDLIKKFNAELEMTFLIVSHSEEQSKRLGHKIIYLEAGKVKWVEVNN